MTEEDDAQLGFEDDSGALFLLNAREQRLVKYLLKATLDSDKGRLYIAKKLDRESLDIAEKLVRRIEEA